MKNLFFFDCENLCEGIEILICEWLSNLMMIYYFYVGGKNFCFDFIYFLGL